MDDEVGYAAWGVAFFTEAVTIDRVLAGINVLAGQPIDVGPMGVGPGRVVKISAQGAIGEAEGEQTSSDPVRFAVRLPVSLGFVIDLGVDKQRFTADIVVPLTITVRARADLAIVLDVAPPTSQQVLVALKAQGLRASIMQHAANVEGELRRFVATYVRRELDKPYVLAARIIDVSRAIDRAIASLSPQRPEPADLAADLDEALEAEIRQSEQLFTPPATRPDAGPGQH